MTAMAQIARWGRVTSTRVVSLGIAAVLMAVAPRAEAITLPPNFQEVVVVPSAANGLSWPVGLAFLPDGRILIIQQSGQIRLVVNGTLVVNALLTMPEVTFNNERGLVGIAVDPDFPTRPFIYIFYSVSSSSTSHVARYTVAGDLSDPNSTNLTISAGSKQLLINQIPDVSPLHNAGTLRFALDKTLYVSLGDDFDSCGAQDLTQLKGKIIRIKVDATITPLDLSTMVPPGNPFAGSANVITKLIWAYGLRNPFRFSIDPLTGGVFLGDVGADTREEADRVSLSGGDNFGWPYLEGSLPFRASCNGAAPNPTAFVPPILEYPHTGGGPWAVIGGPVYRAPSGAGSER